MRSAFIVAATSSGCGKTTLSLGLMRALSRRGMVVSPYKCGPDYIDTQFHGVASGRESINLDLFMSGERHVIDLFRHYAAGADVCVAEGVMGMFDGYDKMHGSSAHLAQVLDIPVVLLVDAASAAYSVAATIYGFTRMNPKVRVAGVVFNRVASERHYAFLADACCDTGVKCYGYLPKNNALQTPSRHLGLTLKTAAEMETFIGKAADEVEKHVDIDVLVADTVAMIPETELPMSKQRHLRVAVARDEAFNFIYPANIEAFGTDIKYFSPIHDLELPQADVVYLPGGYPELFAAELAANTSMKEAIRHYSHSGGRILAECGGFIYLVDEIDGHEMCGIFPMKATMDGSKLQLGYRNVFFGSIAMKGHEFHYSHVTGVEGLESVAVQTNAKGTPVATPVFRYKNTIAGYTHLYWAENDIMKIWD